jgi:hypothetical protein
MADQISRPIRRAPRCVIPRTGVPIVPLGGQPTRGVQLRHARTGESQPGAVGDVAASFPGPALVHDRSVGDQQGQALFV